ncbi:MAG: hypothetical protein WBK95_05905 [Sulfurimonas sp.]|nr:hypothetical protein [Sulfurimonas sp.]MDD3059765.1 hypothetical protein [Sulfurimonas sp.]MDD5202079.1 hypothetical protein [Sulfurimonas sp.]
MQNPFESGHIKNYLLLYASVVVIMVLFFIASTLFHDIPQMQQKLFEVNATQESAQNISQERQTPIEKNSQIKLLDKAY